MSEDEHVLRLLHLAQKELRALTAMGDSETFPDEIFGFHVQQVVEKALKAWIAGLGKRYPVRHDLGELLGVLEEEGQEVEEWWDLVDYTPYAVRFRYEESDPGDAPLDRSAALQRTGRLLLTVRRSLGIVD